MFDKMEKVDTVDVKDIVTFCSENMAMTSVPAQFNSHIKKAAARSINKNSGTIYKDYSWELKIIRVSCTKNLRDWVFIYTLTKINKKKKHTMIDAGDTPGFAQINIQTSDILQEQ